MICSFVADHSDYTKGMNRWRAVENVVSLLKGLADSCDKDHINISELLMWLHFHNEKD